MNVIPLVIMTALANGFTESLLCQIEKTVMTVLLYPQTKVRDILVLNSSGCHLNLHPDVITPKVFYLELSKLICRYVLVKSKILFISNLDLQFQGQ